MSMSLRPDELKSDIIKKSDIAHEEYWIMYPMSWNFSQFRTSSCKVTLTMQYNLESERLERLSNFQAECRANGDRMTKLYLETVGLTINRYELNECMYIRVSPNMHTTTGGPSAPSFEMYAITFNCLYYDQVVKQNRAVKYHKFEPFKLRND